MSFSTVPTADQLEERGIPQLLKNIVGHNERSGDFRVKGPIPKDSVLGFLLRVQWISIVAQECKPECWKLHCPDPSAHVHKIRATSLGKSTVKKLDGEPRTRGSYGDDD